MGKFVWTCFDIGTVNLRFAATSTKALDILKEMVEDWAQRNAVNIEERIGVLREKMLVELTKSFLENQDEFGIVDFCFAEKVEVEE